MSKQTRLTVNQAAMFTICYRKPYKDNDGNDKTAWPSLGLAFKDDDKITLKLDSMPMIRFWDCHLYLFPYEPKEKK